MKAHVLCKQCKGIVWVLSLTGQSEDAGSLEDLCLKKRLVWVSPACRTSLSPTPLRPPKVINSPSIWIDLNSKSLWFFKSAFLGLSFQTSKKTRLCKIILIILQLATICFSANEYSVLLIPLWIFPYFTPVSVKHQIVHYYILNWNSKIKSFAIQCSLQRK